MNTDRNKSRPLLPPSISRLCAYGLICGLFSAASASEIKLTEQNHDIIVTAGDKPFTTVHTRGFARPILYPLTTSSGSQLNRGFPMDEDVEGESKDHPHHQSLWFAHGDVNGIDFWKIGDGKGTIEVLKHTIDGNTVTLENVWKTPEGKPLLTDTTTVSFGETGTLRWIDYAVTLTAGSEAVTIGDTKEGTMAVRTSPELRTKPPAKGKALNSEGDKNSELWGKRASWVSYSGKLGSITIFDHPENLRHPTTWHARDYGLVAANPFGIHDFEKKPERTGDFTLEEGDSLRLRYRFLLAPNELDKREVDEHQKMWLDAKN